MTKFDMPIQIRWSDLDPNFHVRHSAYYDFGAFCRISFLNSHGITPLMMQQNSIGPILFREECVFKKEIKFGDELLINVKLDKVSSSRSRWTMVHEIWKNTGILAAIITVDGAWLNTSLRKLADPPQLIKDSFELLPKTDQFTAP